MSGPVVTQWPEFFPKQAQRFTSRSAVKLARRYRRESVYVPCLERYVPTAHVPPARRDVSKQPVCFLHGFDSSSLDFRKLLPYVEDRCETWAVDLVGWGFSDHSLFVDDPSLPNGPDVKKEHLYQFWKQSIGRPMCVMGVSLGGAVAIDFALTYPEAVSTLVLSAAQGYTDGLGMLSRVPSFVAKIGVQILQTETLRRAANTMAYYNEQIDIDQAMVIGRLHTFLPGFVPEHCVGTNVLSICLFRVDGSFVGFHSERWLLFERQNFVHQCSDTRSLGKRGSCPRDSTR